MDTYSKIVDDIVVLHTSLSKFWKNPHGWAPDNAADMLNAARLEWMPSLAQALRKWTPETAMTDGELVLAWANLGSLMESSLRLFLAVYLNDYMANAAIIQKMNVVHFKGSKKGQIHDPTEIKLDQIKQFTKTKDLLTKKHLAVVDPIQTRRNAIHSFNDKAIDTPAIFKDNVDSYRSLLANIGLRLPYPDDVYFEAHYLAHDITKKSK